MLAGREATWLGATQAARLRHTLRGIVEVDDLLTRMRDRVRVGTWEAHSAARPRLRELVATSNARLLGIADAVDDSVDGYLGSCDLDDVVRTLSLRSAARGLVTLRVTTFDFDQVRELVDTSVVAALDAATSTDPRLRGAGHRVLADVLEAHRLSGIVDM